MQEEARCDPHAYAAYLHLAHGTASGLADMHAAGMAHLDLKPANILLDSWAPSRPNQQASVQYSDWRPTPKLADFGLSAPTDPVTGIVNIEASKYR